MGCTKLEASMLSETQKNRKTDIAKCTTKEMLNDVEKLDIQGSE